MSLSGFPSASSIALSSSSVPVPAAPARAPSSKRHPQPITHSSWEGYVGNTRDALILIEAARQGLLPRIKRRLKEDERRHLVRSGQIFIFDEGEAGIHRWTDGLNWSPSRILQNFLVRIICCDLC